MKNEDDKTDWNPTTWEGSRREQLRRWAQLSMDEILAAQEEMAALAEDLRPGATAKVREEPPTK